MSRPALLRAAALALALVHCFPACSHLTAFFAAPTIADCWKGFGALFAIVLYLLPLRIQARALSALWRYRTTTIRALTLLLVGVHAVPALDHLPHFFESGSWADAWRGFGAA